MAKDLTPQQKLFAQYYAMSGNATESAKQAGYSEKTANEQGSRLLANVSIQAEIEYHRSKVEKKLDIKFEDIIHELKAIAFGNMADLFTWDHETAQFVPKKDLTREQMKFIDAIQVEKKHEELLEYDEDLDKHVTVLKPVLKFKISTLGKEKVKALELLARLLGYDKGEAGGVSEAEKQLQAALIKLNAPGDQ